MRLSILFALLTFSSLKAIIILVHGTFAVSENWCRPGGDFYAVLTEKAKTLNHRVISFAWSGGLSDESRRQGAEALVQTILSYPLEEEKILIGHSHGGNVITLASQILGGVFKTTTTEEKTPKKLKKFYNTIKKPLKKIFIAKKKSRPAVITLSDALETFQDLEEILSRNNNENYLINKVYLLGTPIDQKHYAPDMSIIKNLYNFYSRGDSIQPVFGMFNRLIDNMLRVVNFRITIEDSGLFDDDPSHSEIHGPMVGRWILDIPDNLHNENVYGFEDFIPDKNGKVHFDDNGHPHFKLDNKTTKEREKKETNRTRILQELLVPQVDMKDFKKAGLFKKAKMLGKALNSITINSAFKLPIIKV